MSDKLSIEVPSPGSGTLGKILVESGTVPIGEQIAVLLKAGKVVPPRAGGGRGVGLPMSGPAEETVVVAGIRKAIAEHMVKSKFTAVHTTTFEEVDMSAIVRLRNAHKERLAKDGIKLTFTPFFVKAVTLALRDFPTMNATWNGAESVTIKRYYNIGVAVGRDKGLIVPVLKDCGNKSLVELAQGVEDLATRAHGEKLTLDDLQGGTFSVTNAGLFGSIASTPIINFPEVAILGVHKISDRPLAIDGRVEVRPAMTIALTFDHRWIDGHTAVQYIVRVKELLEQPELLWFVA
jgi:2-oxoglutarate dehydrogenase E2 component (dihydrolipoamide succinyltransferase)